MIPVNIAEGFYGGSLTWSGPRPMHEYHSGHYRTRADTVPFPVFYILTFGSPYQLVVPAYNRRAVKKNAKAFFRLIEIMARNN